MHLIPGLILREIAGNTVAIPTGESAKCLSGLVALNATGKRLFSMLQTEQSESSLTEALTREYEVSTETAQKDVAAFLDVFRSHGLLSEPESIRPETT